MLFLAQNDANNALAIVAVVFGLFALIFGVSDKGGRAGSRDTIVSVRHSDVVSKGFDATRSKEGVDVVRRRRARIGRYLLVGLDSVQGVGDIGAKALGASKVPVIFTAVSTAARISVVSV